MATVQVRLGPADYGRRMTLGDFLEAEEEGGFRYELARGVLEVTQVPNDPHGQVVSNLAGFVHRYKDAHPGLILRVGDGAEFQVWVPERASGRNPDLAVTFHGTPKDDRGRRPPLLVAEVVSGGDEAHRRDYETKREEYLAFGAREYWIVDPVPRLVTVLIRREGAEGPRWEGRAFRGEEAILSPLLPGFAGQVAALWADVEFEDE